MPLVVKMGRFESGRRIRNKKTKDMGFETELWWVENYEYCSRTLMMHEEAGGRG